MFRISVIALAITALLASAPGWQSQSRRRRSDAHVHGRVLRRGRRGHAVFVPPTRMLCLINGERAKHGMSALRAAYDARQRRARPQHGDGRGQVHVARKPQVAEGVKLRAIKAAYLPNATCSSLLGETIAFGAGSLATPRTARCRRS